MNNTSNTQWGTEKPPKVIYYLVLTTLIVSIGVTLFENIFRQFFSISGPEQWFGLSLEGIKHLFLWQPLTYVFLDSSGTEGISAFYLIGLAFNMYVVWVAGTHILDRFGTKSFLTLYFGSAVFAGLVTVGVMALTGNSTLLLGPAPTILGLLTIWAMRQPDLQFFLFFVIPIQAKWLLTWILGYTLFSNLFDRNLIVLVFDFAGVLFCYFYGVIGYKLNGPFEFTREFEDKLHNFSFEFRVKKKSGRSEKIIDMKTGEYMSNDDLFIDAMLSKISEQGEDSLTPEERRKLDKLSKRRK